MIFFGKRLYSLGKSRGILKWTYSMFKKRQGGLAPEVQREVMETMTVLDGAILSGDRRLADEKAHVLETMAPVYFRKNIFDYGKELVVAIILALLIATVIRQSWFELYEIPTGSMRPTFKEQDHLTVSKTAFGINMPMATDHIYFDPALVQRASIVIWSGDGIDLPDTDSSYFWVFPYKKRYIKRLIGKPGDSLYFYGGQIYGVDSDGHEITELRNPAWMKDIEHIPFLTFDGKRRSEKQGELLFLHWNEPTGKLNVSSLSRSNGQVFNGKEWVKDDPAAQLSAHDTIKTFSDFYGMRNFAMARLLTKKQVEKDPGLSLEGVEEGVLYLELAHNPSLTYPAPQIIHDGYSGAVSLTLQPYRTLIPLQQRHLDAIMDHMYTARFVVKNHIAKRYSVENRSFEPMNPRFPDVGDGTYEFYYGKASQIGWGGIESTVSSGDALYSHDAENVQKLFNLGVDFHRYYEPSEKNFNYPHRYAYFRDGSLFLLGAPVFEKDDPLLVSFVKREESREKRSTVQKPYIPFRDYGPPIVDGKVDVDFIRTFGITVPAKEYLVLGDNHAMSADSRVFGFVPEANLQGAPSLIIWPPGSRWGFPDQRPYPLFTLPRVIVWLVAGFVLLVMYLIHRRNLRTPVLKSAVQ